MVGRVCHFVAQLTDNERWGRVQKSTVRLIMGDLYKGYNKSLDILDVEYLINRREKPYINFATKATEPNFKKMTPVRIQKHKMTCRHEKKISLCKK